MLNTFKPASPKPATSTLLLLPWLLSSTPPALSQPYIVAPSSRVREDLTSIFSLLFFFLFPFIYVCVCVYLHEFTFTMCLQYPKRPEEAVGCPRTGVADNLSYLIWVLATKPRSSARAVFQLHLVTVMNPMTKNDLRRKGFISAHRLQSII